MENIVIDFVKELAACRVEGTQLPFYSEKVKGYTEQEIELIAQNCNLDIHGQFRDFLLQMGKCSGGLILGDNFPMYNPYWSSLDFNLFQQNEKIDESYIKAIGFVDPIEKKIFYLCAEDETEFYYYILTENRDDYIWIFCDVDSKSFEKTTITILEMLKFVVNNQAKEYLNCSISEVKFENYINGRLL